VAISRGRFKRSLFGYRPSEVEEALADRDASVARVSAELTAHMADLDTARARILQLELVAEHLSDRVVGRERELRKVRAKLELARAELDRRMKSLLALGEELVAVRNQARGQATRMRMQALREAAELSERIAEVSRRPEARERLVEALEAAIARIGGDDAPEEVPAASNGRLQGRGKAEVFAGMVEVEIGPLGDFSQLVGFEDAAGGIGATKEISVKRFAQGRATLEMKLGEPVELLRELEERAPFEFRVRDQRNDRLVLDVDDEAA
jgi:seryl-tRNA synthetase